MGARCAPCRSYNCRLENATPVGLIINWISIISAGLIYLALQGFVSSARAEEPELTGGPHPALHGAISHSRFNEQDGGLPLLDGSSEHLSVALKQLFVETQAMYTQQALQRSLMYAGGRLGKSNRWFEV